MKVLITGANGFLGKHVIKQFFNYKIETLTPKSSELNVLNFDAVYEYLTFHKPDTILHMAAKCAGILGNRINPGEFLYANTQMGLNIYQAALLNKITRIYTLGSVCAYPKFCPAPFKEDDIWNGYPEETNAPYGLAKKVLLMLGQTYREQYGFSGAHLIPVNMYGEYDTFDPTYSHVIPALIRKFEEAKYAPGTPTVKCWGTGEATREFLYAGDAAEAIVKAVLTGFDSPLPVNLGTGKDISIKNLSYLIRDLVGCNAIINFTGEVSDGQPKRMLDVSRAKELLDWTAKTALVDGLQKTIDWYRSADVCE